MSSKEICGIYCIENIDTHKKYIGQSRHIYKRWSEHRSALNQNIHDNDYLQKAWNKYGESRFIFYILEECSVESLNDKEIYYIDHFCSYDKSVGYNLRGGGGQLTTMTKELKEKFSGQNNPMYGKHHSDDTKVKIGEATRKAYAESGGWDAFKGHTHSDETKRKMSESRSGDKHPRHRDIYCLEMDKIFWGPSDAENQLGISRGNISSCCAGKAQSAGKHPVTGKKLHWMYIEDAMDLGYIDADTFFVKEVS